MKRKKKVYEIDGQKIMLEKLSEFKETLYERVDPKIYEVLIEPIVDSILDLAYKMGFQDGSIEIGDMIKGIILGEIDGPEVNFN